MTTEKALAASMECGFEECVVETRDGALLRVRGARTPVPVRAELLVTHGMGEHCGRYAHVAGALAARGVRVHSYDLRGHGRSSGRRADAVRYEVFLEDLRMLHERVRASGLPVFLFGHSLGGQITARFLECDRPPVAGAVIASPWLRLAFDPPRWKLALARLAPGWRQSTGVQPENLSRDPAHVDSLPETELVNHSISARMFFAVRAGGEAALAAAGDIRLPLLLLHGDADRVTSWKATRDFHARAGSADKTLKIYAGAVHEMHNDLVREEVLRDIGQWIEARVK